MGGPLAVEGIHWSGIRRQDSQTRERTCLTNLRRIGLALRWASDEFELVRSSR